MSDVPKQSKNHPVDFAELVTSAKEAERLAIKRQQAFLTESMWETATAPGSEWQGPLQRKVQDAAYAIWESAGKQQGKALDYWLQAQKAILTPLFEQTREMAESMWKAAGEPLGRSLDFWLEAQKQVLDSLKEASTGEHAEQETRPVASEQSHGASAGRHTAESEP